MECIHCGAELIHYDSYGNSDYTLRGCESGKYGDIYKCPNHEGFESKDEAMAYLETDTEEHFQSRLEEFGWETWEDVVCESATHSCSGSFYTDMRDNLYEGYPC